MGRYSRFPAVNRSTEERAELTGEAPADEEPAAPEPTGKVSDGYSKDLNVGDVLAWAGDDDARRKYALKQERKRDTPRKGVLEGLGA